MPRLKSWKYAIEISDWLDKRDTFLKEDKIVIIFSGYNNRAVISFIRTLEIKRTKYAVIARNDKDPIFNTVYKDKVILTRKSQCLDLEQINYYIETIQYEFNALQCFIAPSTEALNRFLQKYRASLEKMNVLVPLADASVYVSVSDKKTFGEVCRENEIVIPGEYESIVDTKFPFVAKPREYIARNGTIYAPFLIINNEQKLSFLEACDPDDFYFQEYIEGQSLYLLYYFHRNGQVFKFSQENLIQQPDGKSIIAAIPSDFHNTKESLKYEQLFRRLNFYGLVMVEVRVNNDRNIMIEANPRFWGPSQLFVDANMNFFEALLHDYGFIGDAPAFHNPNESKYFWFGGVQMAFRSHRELFYHKGGEQDFLMDLDTWISHDVFKRSDTIDIFRDEML